MNKTHVAEIFAKIPVREEIQGYAYGINAKGEYFCRGKVVLEMSLAGDAARNAIQELMTPFERDFECVKAMDQKMFFQPDKDAEKTLSMSAQEDQVRCDRHINEIVQKKRTAKRSLSVIARSFKKVFA